MNYFWEFGDGYTSTELNPSHTYQKPGTYQVTFTAIDPDTGKLDVTKYIIVIPRNETTYFVTNKCFCLSLADIDVEDYITDYSKLYNDVSAFNNLNNQEQQK